MLLQPQLNLNSTQKLGFRLPPPHKLNVINFSAVPDPILTKLWRLDFGINNNNNNNNKKNNDNNNNNNNNKHKNTESNFSSITDLILTNLLMECFWDKPTSKTATSSSSSTTTTKQKQQQQQLTKFY